MATITKRTAKDGSPSYRVEVRLKGHPAQRATFSRITDAKAWARDTESDIKHGRHFKTTEAKRHTLAGLVDRYTRDVLPTKKAGRYATQPTATTGVVEGRARRLRPGRLYPGHDCRS